MLNSISNNPFFKKSSLHKIFELNPLVFCDVGARGGIHDLVLPLASHTSVVGFEPSNAECELLILRHLNDGTFFDLEVLATGLYSEDCDAVLYHAEASTNTSLYPVSSHYADRYKLTKWKTVCTEQICVRSIDNITPESRLLKSGIDLIKIDTQGSEYEILKGASNQLEKSVLAAVVEVSFFEIYDKQRTFEEIVSLMKFHGMSFYGFSALHTRSRKQIDKSKCLTRERYMQADAVFIRDPLEPNTHFDDPIALGKLIIIAILLEYYDLALEIVQLYNDLTDLEALQSLEAIVVSQATKELQVSVDEIRKAHDDIALNPTMANLVVGTLVDKYRLYNDFKDVNGISSLPSTYQE